MNKHSFDGDLAVELNGHVKKAIIVGAVVYWEEHNRLNGKNEHNGKFWMFNSCRAWLEQYPYLKSEKNVSRWTTELEADGWIESGNFNRHARDVTKWYTVGAKYWAWKKRIAGGGQNLELVCQNEGRVCQNEGTLPVSTTIILNNTQDGESEIEIKGATYEMQFLLNDDEFVVYVCRTQKSERVKVEAAMREFVEELVMTGDTERNTTQLKKYFINWFRSRKKQASQSGRSGGRGGWKNADEVDRI